MTAPNTDRPKQRTFRWVLWLVLAGLPLLFLALAVAGFVTDWGP